MCLISLKSPALQVVAQAWDQISWGQTACPSSLCSVVGARVGLGWGPGWPGKGFGTTVGYYSLSSNPRSNPLSRINPKGFLGRARQNTRVASTGKNTQQEHTMQFRAGLVQSWQLVQSWPFTARFPASIVQSQSDQPPNPHSKGTAMPAIMSALMYK